MVTVHPICHVDVRHKAGKNKMKKEHVRELQTVVCELLGEVPMKNKKTFDKNGATAMWVESICKDVERNNPYKTSEQMYGIARRICMSKIVWA